QTTNNSFSGTLTIRTAMENDFVVIRFEDNGCGMTEEIKQKIFEPFFTTKGVKEGTGLGMSIAFGIIKKHKGRIEVESTDGVGTEISVFLPITQTLE
ncbi:MAG: two-component system NtrC family sensor kinase, partial [bacterium]